MSVPSLESVVLASRLIGVGVGASLEEIEAKARLLMKQRHPDKGTGSSELFREVVEARDLLRRWRLGGRKGSASRSQARKLPFFLGFFILAFGISILVWMRSRDIEPLWSWYLKPPYIERRVTHRLSVVFFVRSGEEGYLDEAHVGKERAAYLSQRCLATSLPGYCSELERLESSTPLR